jgi:hypothetical protein
MSPGFSKKVGAKIDALGRVGVAGNAAAPIAFE